MTLDILWERRRRHSRQGKDDAARLVQLLEDLRLAGAEVDSDDRLVLVLANDSGVKLLVYPAEVVASPWPDPGPPQIAR